MTKTDKKNIEFISNYEEVPDDFRNFVFDRLPNVIFYKKVKKHYIAKCVHCEHETTLLRVRTIKNAICPNCKKQGVLRNSKFNIVSFNDNIFSHLKIVDNNIIQFLYLVNIDFNINERFDIDYNIKIYFEQCDIFKNIDNVNKIKLYKYHKKSNGDYISGRAVQHGSVYNSWISEYSDMDIYFKDDINLLNDTIFKYSCLDIFCNNIKLNPIKYLFEFIKYPFYEKLLKLNLFNLLSDFLLVPYYLHDLTLYAFSNIKRFFGINKEELALATKLNLDYEQISFLPKLRNFKNPITLDIIKIAKVLDYRNEYSVSYERLTNYCLSIFGSNKENLIYENFSNDYYDYFKAIKYLGYNLNDTKYSLPKDFKFAHDLAIARFTEKKRIDDNEKFKKVSLEYYNKYNIIEKKYSLIVPHNYEDLVNESNNNDNCVCTYYERICDGRSLILFLRKTEDLTKSFCTVELDPISLNLVQCRSYSNGKAPDNVIFWLNKKIDFFKKTFL